MVALVPSRHLNIVHLLTDIRDLVVNAVHFMKKLIYHESTKGKKHERKEKFRAFTISCSRD
jgi:hypothetical protein